MSRARFIQRTTAEANRAFDSDVAEGMAIEADRAEFVADWLADALAEAERDAAEYREQFGYPEDTPCIQSADFWGTGEGRFHGVIG